MPKSTNAQRAIARRLIEQYPGIRITQTAGWRMTIGLEADPSVVGPTVDAGEDVPLDAFSARLERAVRGFRQERGLS